MYSIHYSERVWLFSVSFAPFALFFPFTLRSSWLRLWLWLLDECYTSHGFTFIHLTWTRAQIHCEIEVFEAWHMPEDGRRVRWLPKLAKSLTHLVHLASIVAAVRPHSSIIRRFDLSEPPQYVCSACERRGIHAVAIVIAETIECWIYEAVLFVSIRCVFLLLRILLLRVNN